MDEKLSEGSTNGHNSSTEWSSAPTDLAKVQNVDSDDVPEEWPDANTTFEDDSPQKCSNESTAFVHKKSSSTHNRSERTTFCRPSAEQLLHNLKQSLLWSNLSPKDTIYHDKLWQLSNNLLDTKFIEWSKRVWDGQCSVSLSADDTFVTKLQSCEKNISSNVAAAENDDDIKAQLDVSTGEEVMTDVLSDWRAMEASLPQRVKHHVNVLILGCGLAGLGAATALKNTGKCTFLVLEAQSKAGGRVKTDELIDLSDKPLDARQKSSKFVDAGAQWLHGRNNVLYTVSEKHQLLTPDQSEEGLGSFFHENSKKIDEFLVKKVDFHIGELLTECEEFAHNTSLESYPRSVGHFLRERFQQFVNTLDSEWDRQCALDLFDWHIRFQMIDNSCLSLDHLSAKYWGRYSFNGESCQAHYNFRDGFGSVVDHLVNDLPAIHFDKDVQQIQIHNNRIEVNNNSDTDEGVANVSVKCSDGSVYTADHVLVSFSLGVLKKTHANLFCPSLPHTMQTAIDSIGFETINKIFLEFEDAWWHELDGIQFAFQHNEQKKHWTHYLTGFDILKPHRPKMLLGWVGGIGAIQMESLSDNQILDDCLKLLSKFTNKSVPQPIRYYCTRWHSNRYVGGAYSYISTDCDKNDTIAHNLLSRALTFNDFYAANGSKQCDDEHCDGDADVPIVLFAGEACHDKYFSTAHGAMLSGIEQARRIEQLYK